MFRTLLLAFAFVLPTVAFAGATGGPKSTATQVQASATDVFQVTFNGGETATIAIVGDGDTDLDIYVYDENGNAIASNAASGDTATVSFTPAWTGTFRVEVRNLGSVYNQYALITN